MPRISDAMNSDDGTTAYAEARAEMYLDKPDVLRALRLLWHAIDCGHGDAAYAMATWYLHGKEPYIFRDMTRAMQLLEFAVRARVAKAAFDLAVCFEKGEGTPVDRRRAFELYEQAAQWGHDSSAFEVGRCLWHGIGVPVNRALADAWFDRAEAFGVDDQADLPQDASVRRHERGHRDGPRKPRGRG